LRLANLYDATLHFTKVIEYGLSMAAFLGRQAAPPPAGSQIDVWFERSVSDSKIKEHMSGIDYLQIRADGQVRLHIHAVVIDDGGQGEFAGLDREGPHDVERGSHSELGSIVDRAICTATIKGGRMSNEKTGSAVGAGRALQPTEANPLDFAPEKIPFDTPYGPPISLDRAQAVIHAAVAEAKKRNWKMNVAVVDSGGNLVAFQRMDGAMLASIQIAEHKARAAATFRRETKQFEDGIQVMHLNYLLAFDGIIASRGGIPLIEQGASIGAIGSSGGTDSQDDIVSKAGAAVINQLPATNK